MIYPVNDSREEGRAEGKKGEEIFTFMPA